MLPIFLSGSLTDFLRAYCKLSANGIYFDSMKKSGYACYGKAGRYERGSESMSRKEIVVSNVSEEHSNPIAELVQVACRFDSEIILESDNRRINAKSIMGIMAFNPSKGMTVNIEVNGSDEQEALMAMEKFLVCE